jgi:hypothetical protein
VETDKNTLNVIVEVPKSRGKQSPVTGPPRLVTRASKLPGGKKKKTSQPKIPAELAFELLENLRREQNEELKKVYS